MSRFLLVDGHSIAFRAYFALPDSMVDREGVPVHAVYGFLSMLFKLIQELEPTMVAVALDEGRPFREALFPDYKAGRQDVDPNVAVQVTRLTRFLDAMTIPALSKAGYEADDLIATLATQAAAAGDIESIIWSGDRDLFAMIGPRTTLLYPTRSMREAERYDEARLHARWGIRPEQVADFKALVGDPSDRIPGVRGIGEKGATALLQRFGTLDEIYRRLDEVTPPRARAALEAGLESAQLSLALARLVTDVPGVTLDRGAMALHYDRERVRALLLDDLGFGSLAARLP